MKRTLIFDSVITFIYVLVVFVFLSIGAFWAIPRPPVTTVEPSFTVKQGVVKPGDVLFIDSLVQRNYAATVDFDVRLVCDTGDVLSVYNLAKFLNLQAVADAGPIQLLDFQIGVVPSEVSNLRKLGFLLVSCRVESTGAYQLHPLPFLSKVERHTFYSGWFEVNLE